MISYIGGWQGQWIVLQLESDQRRHVSHLGGQLTDPIAAHVQRDQLQVGHLPRNVNQLIVAQHESAQLPQLHHSVGQTGDLVAGRVQLRQFVHAAQFVGQLQEAVVGHQ